MKIKFYTITYNNNTILNEWILKSLYESNYNKNDVEIYVINNHSNLFVEEKYKSIVTVLDNVLRPDFSTGHLARNHNQAIINGFKSLTNPDCDIVISCQNDTIVLPNWQEIIESLVEEYDFLSFGIGDQFQVFTPEGIKKVGIYDERFCNIGYQEADFFLRNLIYNFDRSSINDGYHKRVLNPKQLSPIIVTESGCVRQELSHMESYYFHSFSRNVFHRKWGLLNPDEWNVDELKKFNGLTNIPNFVYYPYFEKDIYDLAGKNYICG